MQAWLSTYEDRDQHPAALDSMKSERCTMVSAMAFDLADAMDAERKKGSGSVSNSPKGDWHKNDLWLIPIIALATLALSVVVVSVLRNEREVISVVPFVDHGFNANRPIRVGRWIVIPSVSGAPSGPEGVFVIHATQHPESHGATEFVDNVTLEPENTNVLIGIPLNQEQMITNALGIGRRGYFIHWANKFAHEHIGNSRRSVPAIRDLEFERDIAPSTKRFFSRLGDRRINVNTRREMGDRNAGTFNRSNVSIANGHALNLKVGNVSDDGPERDCQPVVKGEEPPILRRFLILWCCIGFWGWALSYRDGRYQLRGWGVLWFGFGLFCLTGFPATWGWWV
jgi:hypothetical protein